MPHSAVEADHDGSLTRQKSKVKSSLTRHLRLSANVPELLLRDSALFNSLAYLNGSQARAHSRLCIASASSADCATVYEMAEPERP